jgi:acetyltransferase
VTIRPTLPQDLELQREFFHSLSAEGRYRRFMSPLHELPEALAQSFSSVDYRSHLALLAEVFEDSHEIMIGEARYVIEQGDPVSCEFAIAVADDWHGNGLGRALLTRLEREAASSGIRRMLANTLYDNKPMLRLAVRSGYALKMNREDARLVGLEKRLHVWSPSPTGHRLAA